MQWAHNSCGPWKILQISLPFLLCKIYPLRYKSTSFLAVWALQSLAANVMQKSRPPIVTVGISLTRSKAIERKERKWPVGGERERERSRPVWFSTTFTFSHFHPPPSPLILFRAPAFPVYWRIRRTTKTFREEIARVARQSKYPESWTVTIRERPREREREREKERRGEEEKGRGRRKKRWEEMMKSSFMLYILCMKISDPRESLLLRRAKEGRSSVLG